MGSYLAGLEAFFVLLLLIVFEDLFEQRGVLGAEGLGGGHGWGGSSRGAVMGGSGAGMGVGGWWGVFGAVVVSFGGSVMAGMNFVGLRAATGTLGRVASG